MFEAQAAWITCQMALLAAGLAIGFLSVAKKIGTPLLFTGAVTVIAAELLGRIAFYNLWSVPM